eukprot:CAMPEP_0170604068 /NCGR_PEP_ID=MMETSP0224-20130122/19232_1 /TAXON_ID=285029 /ORGANISM="Togula jolla, Strain CCCM 725" /LENGTH=183 /DNA_ID=CAMNT_0010928959 /DNA_START=219 /DNA_END=771 /DNA_ORIENTATION=+
MRLQAQCPEDDVLQEPHQLDPLCLPVSIALGDEVKADVRRNNHALHLLHLASHLRGSKDTARLHREAKSEQPEATSSASSRIGEARRSLATAQPAAVRSTTAASNAPHQSLVTLKPLCTMVVVTTSMQSARPTTVQQALCQVPPASTSSQPRPWSSSPRLCECMRSTNVEMNAAAESREAIRQ